MGAGALEPQTERAASAFDDAASDLDAARPVFVVAHPLHVPVKIPAARGDLTIPGAERLQLPHHLRGPAFHDVGPDLREPPVARRASPQITSTGGVETTSLALRLFEVPAVLHPVHLHRHAFFGFPSRARLRQSRHAGSHAADPLKQRL